MKERSHAVSALVGAVLTLTIVLLVFAGFKLSQNRVIEGYQTCVDDIVKNVNELGYVKVPVTDSEGKAGFYVLQPMQGEQPEATPTDEQ